MESKTKDNRKKIPFNIIDVFIIMFVLACLVGTVLRIINFKSLESNAHLDDYSILFSVSEIAHTSSKYFVLGDLVTMADRNIVIGELEEISAIEPTKAYVKNSDGNIILIPYPNDTRVDIKGSIASKGVVNQGRYMLGGSVHISEGESYHVITERVDLVLTVTDIVKK